ncbi:LPS export ABC transporter periplasmic protein LptC [Marinobacterium mangrovicola]|uniref:Lipopolysaccharide export system protein LptC n=1 Tax=Marinobacterium mangrovicola TaxID=1476959 RepID=A0A4R1GJG0_9GAMM|nr:LPS export ABC transporter periplasmic protein LptC [Marinobacterium mangrovicola]TCK07310.1 lipopolysaccharide export system protein LptC [Marinobacterium mangrovicola]
MLTAGRLRLLIALLIITPFLVWWGLGGNTMPKTPVVREETNSTYDFFMRDTESRYWGEDGSFQRSWESSEMHHYPARNASQLQQPVAHMPQQEGGTYKIRANEGWILDDQSEIQLAGDVEVNHNPQSGPGSVMATSTLNVFPQTNYAETDALVTLTRNGEQTESTGLEVYFDERRVELLSNVRGRYNAP